MQTVAIVSGANGFVGTHLIEELEKEGMIVYALVNKHVNHSFKNIDVEQIKMGEIQADIFFHFAWHGTSGQLRGDVNSQIKNIDMSCEYLKLAHDCGCKRFVNAGSIMEYEALNSFKNKNYSKGLLYSAAKYTADYFCRILADDLGMEYINVIISNIYGPGERSERFINTIINKMKLNEDILLTDCEQYYDFIYIDDAVKFIACCGINGKSGEEYYIGNEDVKKLKYYVEQLKMALGSNSNIIYGAIEKKAPDLDFDIFDRGSIRKKWGMIPTVDFKMGIMKIIEDEQSGGK